MILENNDQALRVLFGAYWHTQAVLELANELANRHSLFYITTPKSLALVQINNESDFFCPEINVRIERDVKLKNPLYTIDRFVGIWKAVHQHKCNIIHIQETADPMMISMLLMQKKLPIVLTVHDPVPHTGEVDFMRYYRSRKPLMDALRARADMIIVHGENVKRDLIKAYPNLDPERISVVLHGAINVYNSLKKPEYKEKSGNLLFFGRINEYKGLGVLMEAWKRIREECPNAHLVVAGTGPDLDNYRTELQADDRIELDERFISPEEVARHYAEASIVVLPYNDATQSGVALIAIGFGKPVIVTNTGGLPEIVDDGVSGLVVPPKDPAAVAEAVIRLLKDDALRESMAQGAETLRHTRLGWDTLAKQTEQVYYKAIAHRNQINSSK